MNRERFGRGSRIRNYSNADSWGTRRMTPTDIQSDISQALTDAEEIDEDNPRLSNVMERNIRTLHRLRRTAEKKARLARPHRRCNYPVFR